MRFQWIPGVEEAADCKAKLWWLIRSFIYLTFGTLKKHYVKGGFFDSRQHQVIN